MPPWLKALSPILSAISAFILGIAAQRFDYKKAAMNAELQEDKNKADNVHKTNDEWERLYNTQLRVNELLRKDYEGIKKQISDLQEQLGLLKMQVTSFGEKEQGYLLRIEQLESENDDLREENEALKEKLKG